MPVAIWKDATHTLPHSYSQRKHGIIAVDVFRCNPAVEIIPLFDEAVEVIDSIEVIEVSLILCLLGVILNGAVSNLLLNQSEYPRSRKLEVEIMRLRNEINRIGTNVNQIVKNSNSHMYSEDDKINLISHMEQISILHKDFICDRE